MTKKSLVTNSEKGQAIVLLVLLVVGLVAITALAVDGGRLYQGRRQTQNGADNAALAGAQAICSGGDVSSAARAAAAQNGFNNDGTTNTVTVNRPPTSGPATGDNAYVEVIILSKQTPTFAKLIYKGAFQTTARAVGHCEENPPETPGGAGLLILSPDAPGALTKNGNGSVTVSGGVFVNSNSSTAFTLTGAGNLHSDTIDLVGGYSGNLSHVSPAPTSGATALTDPLIALPAPTKPGGACTTISRTGSGPAINPGLYCDIKVTGSGSLTMNPGIYYVNNDFTSSGTLVGTGVFIYVETGTVSLSGLVQLSAPASGTYKGLLIFMARSNSHDVAITGGAGSAITGTIYAPASLAKLAGSTGTFVFDSQVIASMVRVTGDADFEIQYNPNNNYLFGAAKFVELAE